MIYPSQEDVIYLAGIIDGEGSIVLHRRPNRYDYNLILCVGNTSERLLHWIADRFGGAIYPLKQRQVHHRPAWMWTASGSSAAATLQRVRPYLIVKSTQAWLGLEYLATRTNQHGGPGRRIPVEEVALRDGFHLALKAANGGAS